MFLRLLMHCVRAAASRTFWTAGTSSAIKIAMIAITTSNSMSVKPDLLRNLVRDIKDSFAETKIMRHPRSTLHRIDPTKKNNANLGEVLAICQKTAPGQQ